MDSMMIDYQNKAVSTEDLAYNTYKYPQHVFHSVSWAKYMDVNAKNGVERNAVEKNKDAFTLNNVFSRNECEKLIFLSECHGYVMLTSALKGSKYRTNTRVVTDDESLSNLIYERVKHLLPKTCKVNGQIWHLCELNPRFRFCKYTKGQKFQRHVDKRVDSEQYKKEQKASFYTVNIYLNDGLKDYKGGKTMFFNKDWQNNEWVQSSHVVGQPGLALVFNHYPQRYQHSGQSLRGGVKYIMRSDVIYQLRPIQRPQNVLHHHYGGNYKNQQVQRRQLPMSKNTNVQRKKNEKTIRNSHQNLQQNYQKKAAQKRGFAIGDVCVLYGLKRMQKMNGTKCRIVGEYNIKEQRYPVCIINTNEQNIWIKPCNLKRC